MRDYNRVCRLAEQLVEALRAARTRRWIEMKEEMLPTIAEEWVITPNSFTDSLIGRLGMLVDSVWHSPELSLETAAVMVAGQLEIIAHYEKWKRREYQPYDCFKQ